jgi:predicted RNA-binding Zn-ribbon protein involved in translation (DUF1610 family)
MIKFNQKKRKIPYCSKCGARLVLKRTRFVFSNETGERLQNEEYACPNKKSFSLGHDTATKFYWTDKIEVDIDYGML